jgi:hypothetical protein
MTQPWTQRQPLGRIGAPAVRSLALACWRGQDATLDLIAGRPGTFVRGVTRTATDSNGATITYPADVPAWSVRGDLVGLETGVEDRLSWTWSAAPQAMSGALSFIETGGRVTTGRTLLSLSNDAATGARLWLDTDGDYYRIQWTDGSTTRTATLTAGQPTTGQSVVLRWRLAADGALTLWQSINHAPETTATAAALALPATWATDTRLRLNSLGTGTGGQAWYRRLVIAAGVLDASALAALL